MDADVSAHVQAASATAPVDAAQGLRRSGRARKPVEHYIDSFEPPKKANTRQSASSTKKRKRSPTVDSAINVDNDEVQEAKPQSKRIKTQPSKTKDSVDSTTTNEVIPERSSESTAVRKSKTKSTAKTKTKTKSAITPRDAEVRLREYRKEAPHKFEATMFRATSQRMVVLDRNRHSNHKCTHDCPMESVDLAGSTGNVYTVSITHVPTCTCPDFRINKNPQCKHVLYVLVKVLKTPKNLEFQAAFLTSELQEIFDHAGPLPTETVTAEDKDGKRKPVEGDCPICCEELSQEAEPVVWCQAGCGNNLHKSCFDQWAKTQGSGNVTCPYCRTSWQKSAGDALKQTIRTGVKTKEGYVNMAEQLGLNAKRDTSSYRMFPVRKPSDKEDEA